MKKWIFVLAFSFSGCIFNGAKEVSLNELKGFQTTSSYHPLFYMGSDSEYHYFNHLNGKHWVSYKTKRSINSLSFEFEKGSRKGKVMWPGTIETEIGE